MLGPDSNPFDEAMLQADGEAVSSDDPRLVLAEAQLAQQKDKLLRLAAEFDNFKKRSVRERQ